MTSSDGANDLYDNTAAQGLYRHAGQAAWIGLLVNLMLGIVKLVGGIAGSSFALISDAVNSLGDSLTSGIVILALRYAQQPADEQHPYGHTRAEAVAAANVALFIILSALYVGWEAINRLPAVHDLPPLWTLWIAGANVLIKENLYRFNVRVGRRTGSRAIIANAWDHRSDALCSLAVLIGLITVRWGGANTLWADEVAALVVVVAIVASSARLFFHSTSDLMDRQADDELVNRIREAAAEVEGVEAVEKLWVRKTGMEYLADIHIEVDPTMTVDAGHRIGHRVKDHLLERFTRLRGVLVHLEPHPHRPV